MQKILGQVKVDLPYQEWNFHPNMLENLQQQHIRLENLQLKTTPDMQEVKEHLHIKLENLLHNKLFNMIIPI